MPPQAPFSPTAHAFAHHQFSHVTNFWKQGRQASFRLEAHPGGQAELHLTFQLPVSSEVVPPPTHVSPAPQRPIHPLFPKGCFPQGSDADPVTKHTSKKKVSSRQRKSYRRSVLHRAALAATSLLPPKNGSLRQAAQACVQRLQAVSVSTQNAKKRSATLLSPSNLSPLAQRIRSDIGIGENEVESPEKELLRSQPCPENTPPPSSPCVRGFPSPAPLVFTPCKVESEETAKEVEVESEVELESEVEVESEKTAKEVEVAKVDEQDSDWETIIEDCEKGSEIEFPAIDEDCENWAEKYTTSIRRFHNSGNFSSQTDIKETKCPNCGGAFNPHHQC